ncbi:MAG: ANTAR domain-containing response regulator [Chloroflexota bacterium]
MEILIADDEPIIRMGLKAMLQEMGHAVTAASNGREALQLAQRQRFDLAILDIKMPYTDGLQAARTLARTAPLPVILLTAFSERDLIEKASDLPIQGYLVKPVQPGQLSASIAVAHKRFADQQARRAEVDDMAQKLEERKVIDRAKGKLMAGGLSEDAAYRAIQRQARKAQLPMHEVAQRILDA